MQIIDINRVKICIIHCFNNFNIFVIYCLITYAGKYTCIHGEILTYGIIRYERDRDS